MKTPVIAIGIDGGDPLLIEKWITQGHLNNLQKLRQSGAYGLLKNTVNFEGSTTEMGTTEALWVAFATGCKANTTGYWDSIQFHPDTYDVSNDLLDGGYDYQEYLPFYALGKPSTQVAIFDLPTTALIPQLEGIQLLGWGGHFPYTVSDSLPADLFPSIIQKYGKNPLLLEDNGMWWDRKYLKWLRQALPDSINTRSQIARNLLQSQEWDLFLAVFPESHTAGHDVYNHSQPDHPLYPYLRQNNTDTDLLLETYQNIDRAIGEILLRAPDNASVVCFSLHGMGPNYSDTLSCAFLPELLYRFNFPGKVAIAPGQYGTTPPAMITQPIRNSWTGEVWSRNYEPNPIKRLLRPWTPSRFLRNDLNGLASPYPLGEQNVPLASLPARWYQPLWHKMKAFALPSFGHGGIRINLQGREPEGIVTLDEYDNLCDELTHLLYRLKDGRTGKPLVKKVARTRSSPRQDDRKLADADLFIVWAEQITDVVDSPDCGRIGPLPYFRAGTHWNRGFVMVKGPDIAPSSDLPQGEAVDLAPTFLQLMGQTVPSYLEGKSLITSKQVVL